MKPLCNNLTDRYIPLQKGPGNLGCAHECRLLHGQKDKIVKRVLCLGIVFAGPNALEEFSEDDAAETEDLPNHRKLT